jgi:hypothetical protein
MKHLFRFFCYLGLGLMVAACGGSDDPDEPGGGSSGNLVVTNPTVSSITSSSANVEATSTGSAIIGRGFCYSTSANPTINDTKVGVASKDMKATLTGLTASTTYHVRAYVQTSSEVKYSSDVSFTTLGADNPSAEIEDDVANGASLLKRVSVHDPSVVYDHTSQRYYIWFSPCQCMDNQYDGMADGEYSMGNSQQQQCSQLGSFHHSAGDQGEERWQRGRPQLRCPGLG